MRNPLILLVGVAGFEPATPSSRTSGSAKKINKNKRFMARIPVNVLRTSGCISANSCHCIPRRFCEALDMEKITQAEMLKAIALLVREGRAEHTMIDGKPGIRLVPNSAAP